MTRLLTIGSFDGFHDGHRELLQWCGALAVGSFHVAVNQDEFVRGYKGKQPRPLAERQEAIRNAFPISARQHVNPQARPGDSVLPLLQEIQPHLLVVGDDWFPREPGDRGYFDAEFDCQCTGVTPDYLAQIGVTWDDLHDLGITLAFKPRGRSPVHSSNAQSKEI